MLIFCLYLLVIDCALLFIVLYHDANEMAKLEDPLNKLNKKLKTSQQIIDTIYNLKIDNVKHKN